MHSPKKKNTSLAIHPKLSICRCMSYQEIVRGHCKKGRIREVRIKQNF
ncbi:unnamed protein product [Staurois parvus]|uniref:Uncharacterized protein n=1 Tax=Staurois parvus TaxID=386267 RepID=A0ABN9E5X5_9NEOB|nr:unnamed protein product [Staurois parvus]